MRLGDILLAAKIVTEAQIAKATLRQAELGGRLGDNLIATGAVTKEALDKFIAQIPEEPMNAAATGIHPQELLNLLLKLIYGQKLETIPQLSAAIRLPSNIVEELIQMAVQRNLVAALGAMGNAMRYALSELGRKWAQEAMQHSRYVGPAPVTLEAFCANVMKQTVANELVTFDTVRHALKRYNVTDAFVHKIGPALNSGRALLLYGPPGNGKTSVALSFAEVFKSVICIPYAVMIEGQIMRVFDPSFHVLLNAEKPTQPSIFSGLRRESADGRWAAIQRPFVVTGGELTLDMLDLHYDPLAGFYEAPLHIKALGGCFVIDDFGRQMVSPTALLNRWIVPMESRVDYLKLHTGKSFSIPFEALVIFSTNINPEDLMDPAFLRRLPYKIEVGAPARETYRGIFQRICADMEVELTEEFFDLIVAKVTQEKGMELAAFHPRFIMDQVAAISRFQGQPPRLSVPAVDYALDNLQVKAQARPARAPAQG